MKRNLLLTIEYDGAGFSGWQRQPDRRTVQGELERTLGLLCGQAVGLNGASRTDAGVHALGQRANFAGDFAIPTERIPVAANGLLRGGKRGAGLDLGWGAGGDVRVVRAEDMPPDFHARFDAVAKKYIYKIRNASEPNLFCRHYAYHVARPLDLDAMREAAGLIIGTHDFQCFQAAGGEKKETTVRTIFDLRVEGPGCFQSGERTCAQRQASEDCVERQAPTCVQNNGSTPCSGDIEIEVKGDGFLYNMVRIITGTLVEVGLGKMHPQALPAIIESGRRQKAGHTAPPQGLYLADVYYSMI